MTKMSDVKAAKVAPESKFDEEAQRKIESLEIALNRLLDRADDIEGRVKALENPKPKTAPRMTYGS